MVQIEVMHAFQGHPNTLRRMRCSPIDRLIGCGSHLPVPQEVEHGRKVPSVPVYEDGSICRCDEAVAATEHSAEKRRGWGITKRRDRRREKVAADVQVDLQVVRRPMVW